jgi:hypothetical protein
VWWLSRVSRIKTQNRYDDVPDGTSMRISATCAAARAVPSAFISMRPTTVLVVVIAMSGPVRVAPETAVLRSKLRSKCAAALDLSPVATSTPHPGRTESGIAGEDGARRDLEGANNEFKILVGCDSTADWRQDFVSLISQNEKKCFATTDSPATAYRFSPPPASRTSPFLFQAAGRALRNHQRRRDARLGLFVCRR